MSKKIRSNLRKYLKMLLVRKNIIMINKERLWDIRLKIKTCGRDASHSDNDRFPYEPTPYSVLKRLADSGYITKRSVLLDYGCGKGRVGFFLSHMTGCACIGIEVDEGFYRAAKQNRKKAISGSRIKLVRRNAEGYEIPSKVNAIYFFNPFSVEILETVMERVRESTFKVPRRILFFFYYPSDEYVSCLMTVKEMTFLDEIDCSDLFEGKNRRERILIFEWELYEI